MVGESGLGKTTFINTLFSTTINEYQNQAKRRDKQLSKTVNINLVRASLEEKGFKLNLTAIDTPGFGDYIDNTDASTPIIQFVDEQNDAYMNHELGKDREENSSSFVDLRVHVCLYFIPPTGHTLRPLDIQVMKQLGQRCNLIPVIAKADTLTPAAIAAFKDRIRDCIAVNNIQVYSAPVEEGEEEARDTAALMVFLALNAVCHAIFSYWI